MVLQAAGLPASAGLQGSSEGGQPAARGVQLILLRHSSRLASHACHAFLLVVVTTPTPLQSPRRAAPGANLSGFAHAAGAEGGDAKDGAGARSGAAAAAPDQPPAAAAAAAAEPRERKRGARERDGGGAAAAAAGDGAAAKRARGLRADAAPYEPPGPRDVRARNPEDRAAKRARSEPEVRPARLVHGRCSRSARVAALCRASVAQ